MAGCILNAGPTNTCFVGGNQANPPISGSSQSIQLSAIVNPPGCTINAIYVNACPIAGSIPADSIVNGALLGDCPLQTSTSIQQRFHGSKDQDATVTLFRNGLQIGQFTDTNTTAWEIFFSVVVGTNNFRLLFQDQFGNQSEITSSTNVCMTITVQQGRNLLSPIDPNRLNEVLDSSPHSGNFFEYLSSVWGLYQNRSMPIAYWNSMIHGISGLYTQAYQRDNDICILDFKTFRQERCNVVDVKTFTDTREISVPGDIIGVKSINVRLNDPYTQYRYIEPGNIYQSIYDGVDFENVSVSTGSLYIDEGVVYGSGTSFIDANIQPGDEFRLISGVDEGRVFTVSNQRSVITEYRPVAASTTITPTAIIDQTNPSITLVANSSTLTAADYTLNLDSTITVTNGLFLPVDNFTWKLSYLRRDVVDKKCFQLSDTFITAEQKRYKEVGLNTPSIRYVRYAFPRIRALNTNSSFINVGNNIKVSPRNASRLVLYANEVTKVDESIYSNWGHFFFPKHVNNEEYAAAVKALMFAVYHGSTIDNMQSAVSILTGLPFAFNDMVINELVDDRTVAADERVLFKENNFDLSRATSLFADTVNLSPAIRFKIDEFTPDDVVKVTRIITDNNSPEILDFSLSSDGNFIAIKNPVNVTWNINNRDSLSKIKIYYVYLSNASSVSRRIYTTARVPDVAYTKYGSFLNDPDPVIGNGFENITSQVGNDGQGQPKREFYVKCTGGFLWNNNIRPIILKINNDTITGANITAISPDKGLFRIDQFPGWFVDWTGVTLLVGYLKNNYQVKQFGSLTYLNLVTDQQRGNISVKTPFIDGFSWDLTAQNLNTFEFAIKLGTQISNSQTFFPTIDTMEKTVLQEEEEFITKFKPIYTNYVVNQQIIPGAPGGPGGPSVTGTLQSQAKSPGGPQPHPILDPNTNLDALTGFNIVLHEYAAYWDVARDTRLKDFGSGLVLRFGNALDGANSAYNVTLGGTPLATLMLDPNYTGNNATKFRWDHGINPNGRGQFSSTQVLYDKHIIEKALSTYDSASEYDMQFNFDGEVDINARGYVSISGDLVQGSYTYFNSIPANAGMRITVTSGPKTGWYAIILSRTAGVDTLLFINTATIRDNLNNVQTSLDVSPGTRFNIT